MLNSATTIDKQEPAVSLTLQSLIDARFDVPYASSENVKALSPLSGQIRGRNRGQGLEFEDLRNYTSGDDVRHIDWKVSARHNQLYSRLYREEKEQRVTLVVDFTSAMFTGSDELRAVKAGQWAANLAWHEVGAGARCGLTILTDRDLVTLLPALGDKAALAICAELAKQFELAKSNAVSANTLGNKPINIMNRIRGGRRESGALIILSGLDTTNNAFELHLQELAAEKSVAVVYIEDVMEYSALPAGTFRYKSGSKNTSIVINREQATALLARLNEQRQQLRDMFQATRVPLLLSRDGINHTRAALHQLGFLA